VVTVMVSIDETGKVVDAKAITSPDAALSRASEEAARGARFTPTLLSGVPVKVRGIITYRYILQ
jgi:TonB family protein